MTKKQEIIDKLRGARVSHTTWKSFAHLIAKGVLNDPNGDSTPLVPTLCDFGKWYYKDGLVLSSLKSYKDIEMPHEQLHNTYAEIYALKETVVKGGLFKSKGKAEKEKEEEIGEMLKVLDNYVHIVLTVLQRLEEEVEGMSDERIDMLN